MALHALSTDSHTVPRDRCVARQHLRGCVSRRTALRRSRRACCEARRSSRGRINGPRRSVRSSNVAARAKDDDFDSQRETAPPSGVLVELATLALPALLTLACDPVASLVDTAWVGRLGFTQLAGVGVAVSVFNAATKLTNNPLLSVTTSIIATSLGEDNSAGRTPDARKGGLGPATVRGATTALALSLALGLVQAVALAACTGPLVRAVGGTSLGPDAVEAARTFLLVRAAGAPLSCTLLVIQGVFRGIGDTRSPLAATIAANAINLVLDPVLIFGLGWGVGGAASATVAGQAVAVAGLLAALFRHLPEDDRQSPDLVLSRASTSVGDIAGNVWRFVRPTGLLLLRTGANIGCFTLATATAASGGAVAAAAHQVAFQIWLAASLTADAVAIAAQAVMARDLAQGDEARALRAARASHWVGVAMGAVLGLGMIVAAPVIPGTFSKDAEVAAVVTTLLPVVALTQPLNSLAFVWDGILYGANGFRYGPGLMAAAAALPLLLMLAPGGAESVARLAAGVGGPLGALAQCSPELATAWTALAVLMLMRWLTIHGLFAMRAGPFTALPGE